VRQKIHGKENYDKKSAAEKSQQENCDRKSVQEKCGKKSVAEKLRQENHGRKSAAEKPHQQNATRTKRYGFHMCSVEFINQVEGFTCKYVGCPLRSLWLVVELI
jgi:hypothetical protein